MTDILSATEPNELVPGHTAAKDRYPAHAAGRGGVSTSMPARAVLVVLLHPPEVAHLAERVAVAWARVVPAAEVSLLPVMAGEDRARVSLELARRRRAAGLWSSRLVLVGVFGAEEVVLQLVTDSTGQACAGVLVCGEALPPLGLLRATPVQFRPRLRLVWKSNDPMFCAAALGDLLRWLRAAGLDAEGAVVKRRDPSPDLGSSTHLPEPALVRMGGAYLAELVALALDSSSRRDAPMDSTAAFSETGVAQTW
jgi:hypothetical protein